MASWLEVAARAQQAIGTGIAKAGSYLPGNVRVGTTPGSSYGAQIATGNYRSPNVVIPSLVKTASANYTPTTSTPITGGYPYVDPNAGGGSVLGKNNYSGGTTPGGNQQNPYEQLQNNVSTGQGEDLNLIDQEYEQALSELAGQEQALQGQAGVSEGKVRAEGQQYETQLGQSKAESEGVVAGQETQARKEEGLGLRNARDIFRQIQQENIAKLSGLGISSSSVAEALAERLGVETARRIAGITGSTQEVLGNLNKERLRIQQVYTDKVAQVKQDVQNQIAEIQSKLMEGINTINAQRGRAALQKSQARTGIIQEARQQINQLQIKAAEYEQKLRDAAARRSEAIKNTIPLFNVGETGLTQLNPTITAQYQALSQLSPNLNVGINSGMSQGVPTLQGYTFSQKKTGKEANEGDVSPDGTQIYLNGQWQSL